MGILIFEFVVLFLGAIPNYVYLIKMRRIIAGKGKYDYIYSTIMLSFSLGFFKKFINENDFSSEQTETYKTLYKRAKIVKLTWWCWWFLTLFTMIMLCFLGL